MRRSLRSHHRRVFAVFLALVFSALPCRAVPAVNCVTPPPDMVGWWPFDEPSGNTANDLALGNDGVHIGDPTPIEAGPVGGALHFDGNFSAPASIEVPEAMIHSTFDGDFTIDAWARPLNFGSVASKAADEIGFDIGFNFASDPGGNTDLHVFARGTQGDLYDFNCATVDQGEWVHLAVTFDVEDKGTTVTCFINGVPTFSQSPFPFGSLANSAPFRIGDGHWNGEFEGEIDEVELFNRVLDDAEILAIYSSGGNGKCKDDVHVPWDVQYCNGQDWVDVTTTVCNQSTNTRSYSAVSAAPAPTTVNPTCNIPGPTDFLLPSGSVSIPAEECEEMVISVKRPAAMNDPDDVGCYTVTFENTSLGNTFTRAGSVWGHDKICFQGPQGAEDLVLGFPTAIGIEVISRRQLESIPFSVEVAPSDMAGPNQVISLNGQTPGQLVFGELSFDRFGRARIDLLATALALDLFRFYDLLVTTYPRGSLRGRVGFSLGLRTVPRS